MAFQGANILILYVILSQYNNCKHIIARVYIVGIFDGFLTFNSVFYPYDSFSLILYLCVNQHKFILGYVDQLEPKLVQVVLNACLQTGHYWRGSGFPIRCFQLPIKLSYYGDQLFGRGQGQNDLYLLLLYLCLKLSYHIL